MENFTGDKFEFDVSTNYQCLLNDLWRKAFPLIQSENRQCLLLASELPQMDLDAFYLRMQSIKGKLNATKSKVHSVVTAKADALDRWHSFTSFTHPMRKLPQLIIEKCGQNKQPLLCTQAYCKFLQIAAAHPSLLEPVSTSGQKDSFEEEFLRILKSFHLCEAPGAFVLALKHFLANVNKKLDWRMNSFNPNQHICSMNGKGLDSLNDIYSTTIDDRFIMGNIERMVFGPDGSGNILNFTQHFNQKLVAECERFHLITADAGIDCSDEPIDQEQMMLPLIKKQLEVAIDCLCIGGNFLLKIFTIFERDTIELLVKIFNVFEQVHCLKPPSSKPGNSEVYLLCLNFLGQTKTKSIVLSLYLAQQIEECARFFANHQIRFIDFNLKTFRRLSQFERTNLQLQKCTAQSVMAEFLWTKIEKALI